MTALDSSQVIAVVGAGAMGAGIAQVAAKAGHPVLLYDVGAGAAQNGLDRIADGLAKLVERGRMDEIDRGALLERISIVHELDGLASAALVIEAVVEKLEIKQQLFASLENFCAEDVILASNTSSLSITAIGAGLARPERLLGMANLRYTHATRPALSSTAWRAHSMPRACACYRKAPPKPPPSTRSCAIAAGFAWGRSS
jgi:3-hydroxybutyryl-CoA dehydrogenase